MLLDVYARKTGQLILRTTQEMYDHLESTLYKISQLMLRLIEWDVVHLLSRLSPRNSVSPWFHGTFSSFRHGQVGGSTSWWRGVRSMSCSNSCWSISVSICSSACSISWAKSCCYDGSPYQHDASCSYESTIYTGVVSFFCTSCTPYCTCSYYASFYCLWNSCSFWSFPLNSCKSFFVFSILWFFGM